MRFFPPVQRQGDGIHVCLPDQEAMFVNAVRVYNAGAYLSESIDSILKQSYEDFELLIIDDGSEDNSLEIMKSYPDSRIRIYQNDHNLVDVLNLGLKKASGKYIARMDADDIMHPDRLKIQYSILEEAPEITVCGTWMIPFGENIKPGGVSRGGNGFMQSPLLQFIVGNPIFHPTTLIRRDFLLEHELYYEHYDYAEDYRFWIEVAKRKGVFYIETQPLLYYRISENQVSQLKQEEQENTVHSIKRELLEYILQNSMEYPKINEIYKNMLLKNLGLMDFTEIYKFNYLFFSKNINKLNDF